MTIITYELEGDSLDKHYHSVRLIPEKCIGCTDCIKRCPTEAIRVRDGKAVIKNERCIDCGMCIRVCRNFAKKATTQTISEIHNYKYTVAIPAPSLYGQFKKITDVNAILTALKRLGFDDVFEVSRAAEMVTERTKKLMREQDLKKPVISGACPVIIRLISMRFPSLLDNILPIISPMEAAAAAAKNCMEKTGLPRKDIGVFFISPCAAKSTYIENPLGIEKSEVDGVISIQDIYMPLRNAISRLDRIEPLSQSSYMGMNWAVSGGESQNLELENAISVDGMDNVIKVLEQVENGIINDVDFIEALACMGGCIGGPLTVINAYVAKNLMNRTEIAIREMPGDKKREIEVDEAEIAFDFTKDIETVSVMRLDDDMGTAIQKLEQIEDIYDRLPLIDCGSCGAPNCRALAEDIVSGDANIEDCVFMLRKKVKELAEMMVDLSAKLPQTLNIKE